MRSSSKARRPIGGHNFVQQLSLSKQWNERSNLVLSNHSYNLILIVRFKAAKFIGECYYLLENLDNLIDTIVFYRELIIVLI